MLRTLLLLALVTFPSLAAAQSGSATAAARARHAEVRGLARDTPGPARDAAVARILDVSVDYDELARRALGTHWDVATPSARARYVRALHDWIARVYGPRLVGVVEYHVTFGTEDPGPEPVVHARVRRADQPRAEQDDIACRLRRVDGDWRVVDIVVAESSLVRHLGRDADRALGAGGVGWDGLIERIEARGR